MRVKGRVKVEVWVDSTVDVEKETFQSTMATLCRDAHATLDAILKGVKGVTVGATHCPSQVEVL